MIRRQAGGRPARSAAGLLMLFVVAATPVRAQVQDTVRTDTLRADTLTAEQDTLLPPPVMVPWSGRPAPSIGLSRGVWVWDQSALLMEGAVTVLDLLSRVPGITTFRSGVYLQPETASAYGGGADRIRIIWDGYVLDPLSSPAYDLSTIELVHLKEIRVERRPDVLVIHLTSDAPVDARAYSRIEAGVGEPSLNGFRGTLLAPRLLFGPIGLAVERLELEGAGRPQPANMFSTWIRWGLLSESRGVEFMFRHNGLTREAGSPEPIDLARTDFVVRGRSRIGRTAVAEVYFGRSSETVDQTDPEIADSLKYSLDRRSTQLGARLGWSSDRAEVDGGLRIRTESRLPRIEGTLEASGSPVQGVEIEAAMSHQRWEGGPSATSWRLGGSATLFDDLMVFADVGGGTRGAPSWADSIAEPHISRRSLQRGGLSARRWGIEATVAGLRMDADSVVVFGLPGDTAVTAVEGRSVTGWEASARVPLISDWLAAEGSWTAWLSGDRSAYMPASLGRATLEIHTVPLESGNFELLARMDVARRGSLIAPPLAVEEPGVVMPGRTLLNAYLHIRIIDVRIYARFEDMAGNNAEDLPGLLVQGPRIVYGVKWTFWN